MNKPAKKAWVTLAEEAGGNIAWPDAEIATKDAATAAAREAVIRDAHAAEEAESMGSMPTSQDAGATKKGDSQTTESLKNFFEVDLSDRPDAVDVFSSGGETSVDATAELATTVKSVLNGEPPSKHKVLSSEPPGCRCRRLSRWTIRQRKCLGSRAPRSKFPGSRSLASKLTTSR